MTSACHPPNTGEQEVSKVETEELLRCDIWKRGKGQQEKEPKHGEGGKNFYSRSSLEGIVGLGVIEESHGGKGVSPLGTTYDAGEKKEAFP